MNQIIVYAKDGSEKILLGAFEDINTLHIDAQTQLEELGLAKHPIKNSVHAIIGNEEYRLKWSDDNDK